MFPMRILSGASGPVHSYLAGDIDCDHIDHCADRCVGFEKEKMPGL